MEIYKDDFKWTRVSIDRMGRTFSDNDFFLQRDL